MSNILFEEIKLPCGAIIKSRFFKSAMSEGLGNKDHNPKEELLRLYRTWADGGTGLIVTGNVMINRTALGEPNNVVFDESTSLEEISKWAQEGKRNGAHIWVQLNHPGKQSPKVLSPKPVAPSQVPLGGALKKYFALPKELTEGEIEEIIKSFAVAAKKVKDAGFTGVQIHGAHGYLVSQFLSPKHNVRNDKWGGSLDNRMRFLLEIYKAIRTVVGVDFPVGVKLNSADFQKGGFVLDECKVVAKTLDNAGIDLIEISGGTYEAPEMTGGEVKESTKIREAYFLTFAKEIKEVVKCPIVVTGGFRSEEVMKKAILNKDTDMIGIARPLVIMPDLPNRIKNNSYSTIKTPIVKTGIKAIDKKGGMLEIVWYESMMKKIANGKTVNVKNIGIISFISIGIESGLKVFYKRRG